MSKEKLSNDRQEIARKIRDGSYFSDANSWYAIKYLYPITERSLAFLFAICTVLSLFPMLLLLHTAVETNEQISFPMYVEDSSEHFSVIKPLAAKNENPQEAVAKYLITDYITSREEYNSSSMNGEKAKKLLKKIKSSSSKQSLNEYIAYMSENNPHSPLIIYKDHTDRLISIKSLSFLDQDQTSGKAKVTFEVTEKPQKGNPKTRLWEASINFRLPDVETISKSGAPLRFIVNYYRTKPIGPIKEIVPVDNSKAKATTTPNAANTAAANTNSQAKTAEPVKSKPDDTTAKPAATETAKPTAAPTTNAPINTPPTGTSKTQEPVAATTTQPTNQKQ